MLVGIVMGDPMTALVVGASIQLMALGVAAIGGSSVPNYGMAAVVATALTIHTGQDMSVGVAVGIAAGALGVQLDVIAKVLNGFVVRKAQQYCMEKKFKKMERILYLGPVLFFLSAALPTFIILAFGENVTDFIVNSMPKWFTGGLSITGNIPHAIYNPPVNHFGIELTIKSVTFSPNAKIIKVGKAALRKNKTGPK